MTSFRNTLTLCQGIALRLKPYTFLVLSVYFGLLLCDLLVNDLHVDITKVFVDHIPNTTCILHRPL